MMTFNELCQAFPNFEQFDCEGFCVTEWDAGPKCIVTFKQRIGKDGLFLNDSLYWAFLVENEQVGGRDYLYTHLTYEVCVAVERASKKIGGK